MLSTNEKAKFNNIIKHPETGELIMFKHQNSTEFKQNLYILSDDEIKEGDWYYDSEFDSIHKSSFPDGLPPFLKRRCKKIIVTTDESLGLPQPSQSFIEKYVEEYNKGNIITEVLVEYVHLCKKCKMSMRDFGCIADCGKDYIKILKTHPKDNTITIKKVKDSWNREELITIVKKAVNDNNGSFKVIDKWIEENL